MVPFFRYKRMCWDNKRVWIQLQLHQLQRKLQLSCLSGYQVTRANQPISLSNQCTGKWKHKCFRCLFFKMLPDLFSQYNIVELMVLDVNECLETPSICGPNSVCNNTIGDYNCTCWSGYNVTDPSLKSSANNTCTGKVVFTKDLKHLATSENYFLLE